VGSAVGATEAFVVGTVTLIYDRPIRVLPENLTELQPEHHRLITSTMPIWITILVSKRWCGGVNRQTCKPWRTG
jgi:hypothetical protein